jgi:hypothetical protein
VGERESPPTLPWLAEQSEYTSSRFEGGGGGGPKEEVGAESHNIQYRIQNTAAAKLVYIKLPMYLDLIILIGANPLIGQLEGIGPRNGYTPSQSLRPVQYKQQVH